MKNIRSVDLNLLVVFDALFDERSVTRAAARLAVTQPTVSGLLKRLRRAELSLIHFFCGLRMAFCQRAAPKLWRGRSRTLLPVLSRW
jgi:DNA-binding transcriptional ArsR family regulator